MAPQRKNAEENGTTKEKAGNGSTSHSSNNIHAGTGKGKKNAGGSNLKDVTNAASLAAGENGSSSTNGPSGQKDETLDFNALPRRALHTYRSVYALSQPASFKNFHNGILLSNPGSVGLRSPTMLRPRERRRVAKRTLAKAVRAHFMDQSVSELDVEARMMYNAKSIDKAFRMKFAPQLPGKK